MDSSVGKIKKTLNILNVKKTAGASVLLLLSYAHGGVLPNLSGSQSTLRESKQNPFTTQYDEEWVDQMKEPLLNTYLCLHETILDGVIDKVPNLFECLAEQNRNASRTGAALAWRRQHVLASFHVSERAQLMALWWELGHSRAFESKQVYHLKRTYFRRRLYACTQSLQQP